MADYISREETIKEFCDDCMDRDWCKSNGESCSRIKNINSVPAADVRPVVRGKWNRTDAYPHRLYCSVCYKTYLKNDELLERWEFPLNFCPNCGSDMRDGTNGQAKNQTNADIIRGMNDRDLGALFRRFADCRVCPTSCKNSNDQTRAGCAGRWIEWLRKESDKI